MTNRSLIFWDFMAKRYSRQPIADEEAYQKKLEVTRGYFKPDMKVMEFGSGTGSTAIIHAPYVKHILAIAGSTKMTEIARGKADKENIRNVTFKTSTIDEFDVLDQTYDAVMGLSILHLLKNKEEVITKVYKMLKTGGIFVTSTTCMGNTMKFAKFIAPIGRLFGLVLRVFTTEELKKSMTDAGFLIDHEWQPPGKNKAVFIVAKKPGRK